MSYCDVESLSQLASGYDGGGYDGKIKRDADPLLRMSKDIFDNTLHVNLAGAFYTTQCAARQMEQQRPQGGSIIGISSISGEPDYHTLPVPFPLHWLSPLSSTRWRRPTNTLHAHKGRDSITHAELRRCTREV